MINLLRVRGGERELWGTGTMTEKYGHPSMEISFILGGEEHYRILKQQMTWDTEWAKQRQGFQR